MHTSVWKINNNGIVIDNNQYVKYDHIVISICSIPFNLTAVCENKHQLQYGHDSNSAA